MLKLKRLKLTKLRNIDIDDAKRYWRLHHRKLTLSFLPLSGFFIVLLIGLQHFVPTINASLIVACLLLYLTFALLHHHFDKSLKLELIIEYVLLGILILIIVQTLLT